MAITVLDPTILDRLGPHPSAERWRRALHEGGWFAEPSGPERAAFRAIREALAALERVEADVLLARQPIPWIVGTVPRAAWWILGGTFLVLAAVGHVTVGLGIVIGAAFTPVVLLPLALVGLAVSVLQERARRAFLARAEAERPVRSDAVAGCVADLAGRTVVAVVPGGLVVSAPHYAWVNQRLRDLRVSRRPVEPPERDALVAELEAHRERMERALAGGAVDPEALTCDVRALGRRFAAFSVPMDRSGAGRWLAERLAAEG